MSDHIAIVENGVRLKRKLAIAVRTPHYSESFNDRLKKSIPSSDREFKFATGSWIVRYHQNKKVGLRGGDKDGVVVTRSGATLKQESLQL